MKSFKHMIGKTYMYNTREVVVTDVTITEDDLVQIHTDKKTYTLEPIAVAREFLPVEVGKKESQRNLLKLSGDDPDSQALRKLSAILMDNIERVQNNSGYIDQAKIINDSAKNLIELQKAKIETIKVLRDLK